MLKIIINPISEINIQPIKMSRYFWNKDDFLLLPSYILIDGRNRSTPGPPGQKDPKVEQDQLDLPVDLLEILLQ